MLPFRSYTLLQPLRSPALRRDFLNDVFDTCLDLFKVEETNNGFESFFTRYSTLCNLAVNRNGGIGSVTHWHLMEVITLLKDADYQRNEIVSAITAGENFGFEEDLAQTLVDLAATTWLMLSIGKFPGDISYEESLQWSDGKLLTRSGGPGEKSGVIDGEFSPTHASQDVVKLPQTFTAAHLEQIGGIEIKWTSNLADHLLLTDDDTKLMLFHQVSILSLHKDSPSSLLPRALVDETIRSISLLVPPVLGEPNPWFQKEHRKRRLDAQAGVCGRLNSSERQIDKFFYWRDRLVLLKRTFDDAEPRNVRQLWYDDRKKTQWFTFWVAVLVFVMTVFFGLIQSVAGIVQAWASVQSLKK